ncbi:type I glutamate--ammonia ligase [Fusibacter ferrireducens]|uniref:Glutamine synthetase n=1 Tax=Fusibacter ferrireducens TaxID=2785058 RepID=A0ABR9ZM68_9FIRM|nr:type I glutamate--ammonia ligase [Fusibacter ferrireducens]MBF4691570.1 type I glutamate--ammonia ligase [Fusibacter ferrireducens]
MFNTYLEAKQYIEENQIKILDFKITDMFGRWHHLSIPASRFDETILKNGIGFDGSSYGILTVEKSDMVFIPDITSAFVAPFQAIPTLTMIGNIYTVHNGRVRFDDDPRYVVEKAKKLLVDSGIADTALLGPEFEFYILDEVSVTTEVNHMEVKIDSRQGIWNSSSKENNKGLAIRDHNGYHLDKPFDVNSDFRDLVTLCLEANDIPVKYHHGENGGPGQVEIEVVHGDIVEMSDRSLKLKSILRAYAEHYGKTITFMPKPFSGECGSGLHVHIHLFKEGKPLFYDEAGYSGLSQMALHAIGGLLKHAPAIMPFTNPSTNSYKRLIPGFEAPVSICFGTANRSAVIRIPGYATEPHEKRFEIRSPDATCNPYFAYSAILMAVIDGIENKIDPTAEGFGPYDINLYTLDEDKKKLVRGLPTNLLEAADALENDYEFLLKSGVFTKNIIQNQIKKIRADHMKIAQLPHPEEYKMYYNL